MGNSVAKKQHIAVSAGLNIIRKACMIAFPLITYAYATRVLGTTQIGVYEFSQSIVSYFALIAALGITQYAVRDGAEYFKSSSVVEGANSTPEKEGKNLAQFASEVFSINLVMTFISYGIMGILLFVNPLLSAYKGAIFIYSISILFTTLGVDWINSLFEDYLYLTIRYIVVSVIAIIALLLFVKGPEDLYKYIAISIFATVINGILNFIYIQKFVRVRFTFNLNLAKHGLPIFILFCNNIASVIYLNSDVTILRVLTDDDTVGLYGVASKIYSMIKELMNAAIFVTIPRFSMYVAEGAADSKGDSLDGRYVSGLRNLLTPLLTGLVPSCVGLFFLSENVVNIVAGSDFIGGAVALRVLAIAMFFAVTACFLAYAIIMPYKLERYFLVATTIAAIVNIVLNLILIPIIGMPAAALTTLLAEIMVFTMLAIIASKRVRLRLIINIRDISSIVLGSVLVGLVCIVSRIIFKTGSIGILSTVCVICVAAIIYGIVQVVMKNTVIDSIISIATRRGKN